MSVMPLSQFYTMKPFTVAAGLETGLLRGDQTYVCGGFKHVGDYDIACHLRSGHGTVSVQDSIAYSCNVGLMDMAEVIGVENFIRYQHIFGFGEYTGIDLPGEAATEALLYTTGPCMNRNLPPALSDRGLM